jgi:hypothetical protein
MHWINRNYRYSEALCIDLKMRCASNDMRGRCARHILNFLRPGVVAHTCNPNYSGGRNRRIQPGQKVSDSPISTNKLNVVAHICNPS